MVLPSHVFHTKERLINSRLPKSSVSKWIDTGTPLEMRWSGSVILRCRPLSGRPEPCSRTLRLDSRQQAPPRHVEIRQPAADLEPVRVLRQPSIPHFSPAEDPLDHQERMFDLRPDF